MNLPPPQLNRDTCCKLPQALEQRRRCTMWHCNPAKPGWEEVAALPGGPAPRAEPALAIVFEQGLCKQRCVPGQGRCCLFLSAAADQRFRGIDLGPESVCEENCDWSETRWALGTESIMPWSGVESQGVDRWGRRRRGGRGGCSGLGDVERKRSIISSYL